MIARAVLALSLSLLFSWGMALVVLADVAGNLTNAGNGPELTTIEPKEPHPLSEVFTQFVLSQAGQQLIAETYIPINET